MELTQQTFSQFIKALHFAAQKHQFQKRKDGVIPYINHPIDVVQILWETGVREPVTLIAALLHDVIEDTPTSPAEIGELFGDKVLALVAEVTDDKTLPKTERKRRQVESASHKSPGAAQIKIADKISNICAIVAYPPGDWPLQRKLEYLAWSEQVVQGLRGCSRPLEDRYDQTLAQAREALHGLPGG